VFAASWCCSVGVTWTVELRPVGGIAPAGPVVEWISSGVPTELPVPEAGTADVLAERNLLLFRDEDQGGAAPRTRSRWLVGYATRHPEVLKLARMLADLVDDEVSHPMVLAAQWIEAGYAAGDAASWVSAGFTWPDMAHTLLGAELDFPPRSAWCRTG
jgi:hypothetical protein